MLILDIYDSHHLFAGSNQRGSLLLASVEFSVVNVLTRVPYTFSNIRHLVCGEGHTLIVDGASTLVAGGGNACGQLGLGHYQPVIYSPTIVSTPNSGQYHRITHVSCGLVFSVIVYGWC